MSLDFFTSLLGPVCLGCKARTSFHESLCSLCRATLFSPLSEPLLARIPQLDTALIAVQFFEGRWAQLIRAAKKSPQGYLIDCLTKQLREVIPPTMLSWPVITVPTGSWRAPHLNEALLSELRRQGSQIIRPSPLHLVHGGLMSGKQKTTDLAGRLSTPSPYRCSLSPSLSGSRGPVLLFDDVVTTGATMSACVDLLLEAGYGPVATLTLGLTPLKNGRAGSPLVMMDARDCGTQK